MRRAELSAMYKPVIDLALDYERLLCRITLVLGRTHPSDCRDRSLRDLMNDAFNSLFLARTMITSGYSTAPVVLLRRAFETICLIQYLALCPEKAQQWDAGREIKNAEIRKFLGSHALGEEEEELKGLYRFFSSGAHINRDFVPEKRLGDGNQFTLGTIALPDLTHVTICVSYLLGLWFWFTPVVLSVWRETIVRDDPDFGGDYLRAAERVKPLRTELAKAIEKLRGEPPHVSGTGGQSNP